MGPLIDPKDHPDRGCRLCKQEPYCATCWTHHAQLVNPPFYTGQRPRRVVTLDAEGNAASVAMEWPEGCAVDGAADVALAVQLARDAPGTRTAVEVLGSWHQPDAWRRFAVCGPFGPGGEVIRERVEPGEGRCVQQAAAADVPLAGQTKRPRSRRRR